MTDRLATVTRQDALFLCIVVVLDRNSASADTVLKSKSESGARKADRDIHRGYRISKFHIPMTPMKINRSGFNFLFFFNAHQFS